MQNENKEIVDLYIPRKCSWTNRLIEAKDKASVQVRRRPRPPSPPLPAYHQSHHHPRHPYRRLPTPPPTLPTTHRVQFAVGDIDPASGLYTGDTKTIAIAGYVRHHSESDMAVWHLHTKGTRSAATQK